MFARIEQTNDPAAAVTANLVGQSAAQLQHAASIDKIAATHIRNLILKSVAPVLSKTRPPPDVLDEYRQEFGALGGTLHTLVCRIRPASSSASSSSAKTSSSVHPAKGPTPGEEYVVNLGAIVKLRQIVHAFFSSATLADGWWFRWDFNSWHPSHPRRGGAGTRRRYAYSSAAAPTISSRRIQLTRKNITSSCSAFLYIFLRN